jgi:soluble lytic murein transglycosylase-like protein
MARQDAIDNGIDPTLFERQINQESGFNPDAISSAGAIGIAQIMSSTASEWNVNPHDPVASLSAAAKAMAWYYHHYGSYAKALSAYNGGSSKLNYCIANYSDWLSCMPGETQRYVAAIGG